MSENHAMCSTTSTENSAAQHAALIDLWRRLDEALPYETELLNHKDDGTRDGKVWVWQFEEFEFHVECFFLRNDMDGAEIATNYHGNSGTGPIRLVHGNAINPNHPYTSAKEIPGFLDALLKFAGQFDFLPRSTDAETLMRDFLRERKKYLANIEGTWRLSTIHGYCWFETKNSQFYRLIDVFDNSLFQS